jgi:hypothetical protein
MTLNTSLPTSARKRSYVDRTGMTTRSARVLAKAINERPAFIEDADEHLIRQWKPEELQRYSNDDIKSALRFRHVAEAEELTETIPPTAVKYGVTKGWLRQDERGGWYHVTRKAAAELDLPRQHRGRKIRFAA